MDRARTGIAAWLPERPGGWAVLGAFLIFGATVCVTGFYAVQEIEEAGSQRGSVSAGLATPPVAESRAATSSMPRESRETPPAPTVADGDEPLQVETVVTPPPMPAVPKVSYRRSGDGKLPKSANLPAEFPGRSSDTDPALRPSEEASSAPVMVAAPIVVAEQPVVPDRWQAMNTALDQCSRESFFAGVVCSERARLQYCDGYWGTVPQCRGANRPENSR